MDPNLDMLDLNNQPLPQDPNGIPEDVLRSVGAMQVPQAGKAHFDLSFIQAIENAPPGEDRRMYDSLPPVMKHVYDRSVGHQSISPQWASERADEFFKLQQERQAKSEDPIRQSKIAEAKRTESEYKASRATTIKNIESILADPDMPGLVGPWDGTVGAAIDASGWSPEKQAKRMKLDRLLKVDVLNMTKFLRPVSQDELKFLRSMVPGQMTHWETTEQYLKEKLDELKAAERPMVNPSSNEILQWDDAPSAPATQQTAAPAAGEGFVVGKTYTDGSGRTGKYLGQNPDGTPKFELVQ
jgi:hypothetical protein